MARTSRKKTLERSMADQARIYRAAGYVRLSVEDGGKPDAGTLETQKELLLKYIEKAPGLCLYRLYCDNGRTGTDFNRPAFDSMMEDARRGKIDCIVVKDLSRFGRNYKEAGNYIERVFPALGIRFIAVDDRLDTLKVRQPEADFLVPLKNIIHDAYSKDISRKIGSALAIKKRKGKFVGPWAPYGYRKSPRNPHRFVPDEAAAPVVREIFRRRLEGKGYREIAAWLNRENIPSPGKLRYLRRPEKFPRNEQCLWSAATIKFILGNRVYLGHMEQGKYHRDLSRGIPDHRVEPQDWLITEGTHTPLVGKDAFETVQRIGAAKKAEAHHESG